MPLAKFLFQEGVVAYHQQLSTLCASLFTEDWSELCAVLQHLEQHTEPHLLDDVFLMLFGVLQGSKLALSPVSASVVARSPPAKAILVRIFLSRHCR